MIIPHCCPMCMPRYDPILKYIDVSDKGHDPHFLKSYEEEYMDDLYECSKCRVRLSKRKGGMAVLVDMADRPNYGNLTCEQIQIKYSWLVIVKDSCDLGEIAALARQEGGEKVAVGIGNRITFMGNSVTKSFVQMDKRVEEVIER